MLQTGPNRVVAYRVIQNSLYCHKDLVGRRGPVTLFEAAIIVCTGVFDAQPTASERQREGLSTRLRREFGLALPEDEEARPPPDATAPALSFPGTGPIPGHHNLLLLGQTAHNIASLENCSRGEGSPGDGTRGSCRGSPDLTVPLNLPMPAHHRRIKWGRRGV